MARSRNIKPGFFTNDMLGDMDPLARLLFAGLWTICDRDGRVADRPKKIKAEVLPYDTCDCDDLLQQLHDSGFILRYGDVEDRFIQVVQWGKHQTPHIKESASTLPAPDKYSAKPDASTVQAPDKPQPKPAPAHLIPDSGFLIPDSLSSDSGYRIPDTKVPRKKRGTSIPQGFGISQRVQTWATEKGYAQLPAQLESFVSYAKRKDAQYVDWDEALMNAIREDWAKVRTGNGMHQSKADRDREAMSILGFKPPGDIIDA